MVWLKYVFKLLDKYFIVVCLLIKEIFVWGYFFFEVIVVEIFVNDVLIIIIFICFFFC